MAAWLNDHFEVTAPSRLHFGLLSFGQTQGRQFGGAGVMVDRPGVCLRFSRGERLNAKGPLHERALEFARRYVRFYELNEEPCCSIEVARAPRQHTGLGVGTSLAMAVAAGLNRVLGRVESAVEELARSVGRAKRSSVGAHGFRHGGFIVEAGKLATEEVSPLLARVALPAPWRFVLICPAKEVGLFGQVEEETFHRLPPVPIEVTQSLSRELFTDMLPAARRGDFAQFSESLFRFGCTVGKCFSAPPHQAFASEGTTRLVERVRSMGVRGVGQSSWGPTLFALLPEPAAAESLVQELRASPQFADLELNIASINQSGAQII